MSQKEITEQSLKGRKVKNSKQPGILSMHSNSVKNQLKQRVPNETNAPSKNRRVVYNRAESSDEKCLIHLNIFLAPDSYFYLATSSCLIHQGHSYIPPDAISRGENDLDDNDKSFVEMMYEHRVRNSTIGNILQSMNGKESGQFIQKAIYYMNKKTEDMLNIAEGITADMTDAQKTLKKLEL